jgi:phosphotransferase system enzyme I (PtsP)
MLRDKFPTVAQQAAIYRRVLDQAGERPVTFRTLDIGGDKLLPYMEDDIADENPAMGWRAIRIALDRPALLRQQLRALIRAAANRSLRVMFPMIADVSELEEARAIFDLELDRQRQEKGEVPTKIEIGLMLEVPALLWQLPLVFKRADFISVGTNDLVQFLFASDRGNPRLADRYDALSKPVLHVLGDIAAACAAEGMPVAVCGEMAGHPLDAMVLVGLGFRSLSMTPFSIGPVKAMIRSLDIAVLTEFIRSLGDVPTHSLRGKFHDFARDRGINLP